MCIRDSPEHEGRRNVRGLGECAPEASHGLAGRARPCDVSRVAELRRGGTARARGDRGLELCREGRGRVRGVEVEEDLVEAEVLRDLGVLGEQVRAVSYTHLTL